MVPVYTAGQLQRCTLKRVDECVLVFFRSKTKLCISTSQKSSLEEMSCLTRLEPLKDQLGVSSVALAKPALKTSAKQC